VRVFGKHTQPISRYIINSEGMKEQLGMIARVRDFPQERGDERQLHLEQIPSKLGNPEAAALDWPVGTEQCLEPDSE
jgi:hypothetical protein